MIREWGWWFWVCFETRIKSMTIISCSKYALWGHLNHNFKQKRPNWLKLWFHPTSYDLNWPLVTLTLIWTCWVISDLSFFNHFELQKEQKHKIFSNITFERSWIFMNGTCSRNSKMNELPHRSTVPTGPFQDPREITQLCRRLKGSGIFYLSTNQISWTGVVQDF